MPRFFTSLCGSFLLYFGIWSCLGIREILLCVMFEFHKFIVRVKFDAMNK